MKQSADLDSTEDSKYAHILGWTLASRDVEIFTAGVTAGALAVGVVVSVGAYFIF